jgi:hypothetical protein
MDRCGAERHAELIPSGKSGNRKSLTMSALSSPVFVFSQIFCHLFSFCEHTTTFTPKSGLVRFALPLADDHGSFINLSVGFSPT